MRRPGLWVQGILAPLQFLVFLISLWLVVSFLVSGQGYAAAAASIVIKTMVLYAIMITGSIWEHDVFGRYLFAPAFYWEDVVSMLVLALHTFYLVALFTGWLSPVELMLLALAAYASYAINATQFLLKLRAARLSPADDNLGSVAEAAHEQHGASRRRTCSNGLQRLARLASARASAKYSAA